MNTKQYRILIIDDNPHILSTVPVLLRPRFGQVMTLDRHDIALSVLRDEHFDLVLLDMHFAFGLYKGREGFGFLHAIRELNPEALVVLMAGSDHISHAREGLAEGASDFLIKPWNPDKLVSNLVMLLRLRDLEKENAFLRELFDKKKKNEVFNLEETEKQVLRKAVFAYRGNMSHAARQLGITRATLYAKIKKYNISP